MTMDTPTAFKLNTSATRTGITVLRSAVILVWATLKTAKDCNNAKITCMDSLSKLWSLSVVLLAVLQSSLG